MFFLGTDLNGAYLAGPATLTTTEETTGYFYWQVLSGPAELWDPAAQNWASVVSYTLTSDDYGSVQVRATDKSSTLNNIQIRLKWTPASIPEKAVEIITWKITAFAPKMSPLAQNEPPGPIQDLPIGTWGYQSNHNYRIVYELDDQAVMPHFNVNEMRGERVDKLSNTWPTIEMRNGPTNNLGVFTDELKMYGSLNPQTLPPGCSQNPSVVQYKSHVWRGGSIISGNGIPLETPKTMDYRICNARRL